MTDVIEFGGTSLCRTESLIQSEIPYVSIELCKTVIENPARVEMQADGRIRYWGQVGKKWLRVVVENDALHNAFFDRSYKP